VRAVLDANVLFPFTLRDTLLRAAAEGCFQAYWSERILDEATRNLVETGVMTSKQAARLRAVMEQEGAAPGRAAGERGLPHPAPHLLLAPGDAGGDAQGHPGAGGPPGAHDDPALRDLKGTTLPGQTKPSGVE